MGTVKKSGKGAKGRQSQRGRAHADSVKAQVVAALLLGMGVMEVARQFGLPQQTVSTYKADIPPDKLGELRTKKGERIEEMVVDYLTTSLAALQKQAEIAGTEEYIKKQPAGELYLLHGTIADKAIRILEAIHRGDGQRKLTDGDA